MTVLAYVCTAVAIIPLTWITTYVVIRGLGAWDIEFFTELPRLYGSGGAIGQLPELQKARSVLGAIVWTMGMHDAAIRTALEALAAVPRVALLDENDTAGSLVPAGARHRCRQFSIALNRQAGADVAAWLLGQGQRALAFISPYHRAPWARQRFAGICEAYRRQGLPNAVRLFAIDLQSRVELLQRKFARMKQDEVLVLVH